jgi:hypothetical protein
MKNAGIIRILLLKQSLSMNINGAARDVRTTASAKLGFIRGPAKRPDVITWTELALEPCALALE